MVKLSTKITYHCPYCGYFDEDEDDVYEHRKEHLEKIEEQYSDIYICEICKQDFKTNSRAYDCEEKHRNNEDKKYQAYLEDIEKTKLLIEGNKPNQKKLL